MPFWKAKRKTEPSQRIMMCAKCHGKSLRYANNTGMIFFQPQLYCPDCGYTGRVYVDIEPNDQHEAEIEQILVEDNPEFLETRKSAKVLACLSLEHKWKPNQEDNKSALRDWCPFCEDVQIICNICKCPREICNNHATEGWIGDLNTMYDDETELCDVDPTLYQKIVKKFQILCESGSE